jgi:hypothetical protein
MIRNLTDICTALAVQWTDETPATIKARMADKADPLAYLARLVRVYHRAERRAPALGLVGVGCISFAEARLQLFQRRAAWKV